MRRRYCTLLALLILLVLPLAAQELVTLTTPVVRPNTTTVRVTRVILETAANGSATVMIYWKGNNEEPFSAVYPTPAVNNVCTPAVAQLSGAALLTALNKMNFAAGNPSFINRVITRLQTDCYIAAGTISGTPE